MKKKLLNKNFKKVKVLDEIMKKIETKTKKKEITLDDVITTIEKWSRDNDIHFIGSFMSFDKNNDVKEDSVIAFGTKEMVEMSLEEMSKMVKDEKDDFISW